MPTVKWNNLVSQDRVKELLSHAFESGALGHAYLFCGERGVGKFAAAVDLAMAVLCQGGGMDAARPCGGCPSCRKAASYSHPDLHVIMPLCLSDEHKGDKGTLTTKGWEYAAESAKARMDDPYKLPRYDGIPNIPVDWIREADHAVMRGASEGGGSVVIIDGVETMSKESANAMLKTLEEPPPGTLMLLLTERAHGALPTILSRCQIVRFPLLPPEVVAAELYGRFISTPLNDRASTPLNDRASTPLNDRALASLNDRVTAELPSGIAAAAASGSIGIAISEYENPLDEYYEYAASLWSDCLGGDWMAAATAADGLSSGKDSYNACRNTINCLIRLIRAAFLKKFGHSGASMNYIKPELPDGAAGVGSATGWPNEIELPAAVGAPSGISTVVGMAQGALNDLDAHGNASLVMAGLVCSLTEALNVKKQ